MRKIKQIKWSRVLNVSLAVLLATCITLLGFNITIEKQSKELPKLVLSVGSVEAYNQTPDYIGLTDVQVQQALNALPVTGGEIDLISPVYTFAATVSRAIPNVTIKGNNGTTVNWNASSPLFSVGAQTGWKFQDLKTDAGGITNSGNALLENITLGATYYSLQSTTPIHNPTGITASYVVATLDATTQEKAQANETLTGVAATDTARLNVLIAAATGWGYKLVVLGSTVATSATLTFAVPDLKVDFHPLIIGGTVTYPLVTLGSVITASPRMNLTFNSLLGEGAGGTNSNDGIDVIGTCALSTVNFTDIGNCNHGIYFVQNGVSKGEVYFHSQGLGYTWGNNYDFMIQAPHDAYNDNMEGIELHSGFVGGAVTAGIDLNGLSGAFLFDGEIDNGATPNIIDNATGNSGDYYTGSLFIGKYILLNAGCVIRAWDQVINVSGPAGQSQQAMIMSQTLWGQPLTNGGFETGSPPTGWTNTAGSATVSQNSTYAYYGTYSLKMVCTSGAGYCYQAISNYLVYAGRSVTVGVWCKTTSTNCIISVVDGTNTAQSITHPGDNAWHFLSCTYTVAGSPSYLRVLLYDPIGSSTSYWDGVVLVSTP